MVLVKDDLVHQPNLKERGRKKAIESNSFHQTKNNVVECKTKGKKESSPKESDKRDLNTSELSLMENLYNFDITLSRNLSVCADKKSGRWRSLMILLEISGHGVPWIVGTVFSVIFFSDVTQEFACNLLLALIFDLVVVGGLKVMVRRKRPVYNEGDMFATVSVDNYSFPSGHSTRAAMVAGLFAMFIENGLWRILIGCWALCVSMSRIILGRHHVSDVFCGVLIGLLQCWTICTIWLASKTCQELLSLIPYFYELRKQGHVLFQN